MMRQCLQDLFQVECVIRIYNQTNINMSDQNIATEPNARFLNSNLIILILCQGLFLTNNVTFIAINGLVGLSLTTIPWLATLPVMSYVIGGAVSTSLVSKVQAKLGRKRSFQIGLLVAVFSSLICAYADWAHNFYLLIFGTLVAGFYSANGQLYRFAAVELTSSQFKEKAVSWVLAGGLIGAIVGPNLASWTRALFETQFLGAYLCLSVVAFVGIFLMQMIHFPDDLTVHTPSDQDRSLFQMIAHPVFIVSVICAAFGYGVMNLLMAATPLAMKVCGLPFQDTALVLEWHVIGMFAPGFFTGSLIRRFGIFKIMNLMCVAIALSGNDLNHFLFALICLGVGWNFLFTGATTLAITAYKPQEKNRAQGTINFFVFATMATTSFGSGALVTTQGWSLLNICSTLLVLIIGAALLWWRLGSAYRLKSLSAL